MSEILTMPVEAKPMKIAFFAGTMKPGQDGVTRVLYRWIEGLRERGVDQMFFSPIVPPGTHQPVPMVRVPSVTFPWYKDYRVAVPGTRHFEAVLAVIGQLSDMVRLAQPAVEGFQVRRDQVRAANIRGGNIQAKIPRSARRTFGVQDRDFNFFFDNHVGTRKDLQKDPIGSGPELAQGGRDQARGGSLTP